MTVNLSALAGAGQQFFDNNGTPLSGGKLYSYAAGTTTPQATYTSASGATAHTNPIVLDSAGRVATGEIWLTAGSNYKFVLKTSTETTIATWDNITGINGTGITSNADSVEYDPPFTGALTSGYTVEDKLAQNVSVKDFGATGDGSTDDTTAIQAALDSGALEVVFPAGGTYIVNGGLISNQAGQVIRAYGATIKLKNSASTKGMLRLNGAGSSVMGGTWDGNKANGNGTTGSFPADLYTSWNIFVFADRCTVRDCYSINTYGMFCNGGTVSDTLFENNTIRNTQGYGLFLSTGSVNSYRNRAIGNNIDMSEGGVFGQGILFTGAGGTIAVKQFDWEISNNTVIGSQDAAMADQGINLGVRGSRGIVSNNITRYGAMGWSEGGTDTVITGNSFLDMVGSVRYGIEISGGNTTVSGNVVSNAINGVIISGTLANFDNLCITGNRIQSTRDGIRLQVGAGAASNNISITGNNITTDLRGVITTGDVVNLTIASNVIVGPGSGTANSRGVYLENPPADAYVSVQGNTIASFQRACGVYSASALAVNKLYATGNNISNDTGSSSRAWSFEGLATMGIDVIFAWGPTNIGLRENRLDGEIKFNISTGSPEGVVTASVGSLYLRSNGGANTTLYVKESGTGNTGWVAK
jgi:hypothetical protein